LIQVGMHGYDPKDLRFYDSGIMMFCRISKECWK